MAHPGFVVASAYSRFLTGLSARFGMTKVLLACSTTEVVPFPGVALAKSSSGLGIVFWLVVAAGLDCQAGVGLQ
jgi:hypothetical protein